MIRKQIPNLLTSLNLAFGIAGIINVFEGDYTNTIFFILFCGLFDLLDGLVARALKVSGELGKQLDSLADAISFGALPALYWFQLSNALGNDTWVSYSAILIAVFSAWRLAKFNIDDQQSDKFIGLPTPANAIMITTIAQLPIHLLNSELLIVIISLVSSFLLISPLEMIALKFKNYSFSENVFRYALIFCVIGSLALFGWMALPFIIPIYVFLSIAALIASLSGKKGKFE